MNPFDTPAKIQTHKFKTCPPPRTPLTKPLKMGKKSKNSPINAYDTTKKPKIKPQVDVVNSKGKVRENPCRSHRIASKTKMKEKAYSLEKFIDEDNDGSENEKSSTIISTHVFDTLHADTKDSPQNKNIMNSLGSKKSKPILEMLL